VPDDCTGCVHARTRLARKEELKQQKLLGEIASAWDEPTGLWNKYQDNDASKTRLSAKEANNYLAEILQLYIYGRRNELL
jgi:hypothetical protein